MAGIVTGLGLGFQNSSASQLGAGGVLGSTQFGRGSERVYVNAANGNLVVSQIDEFLSGSNINLNRTYNSQGRANDDNGDNWRLGYSRSLTLNGTRNTAGSTLTRTAEDGSELVYNFDVAKQQYIGKAANGRSYAIGYDNGQWMWQDKTAGISEYYDANNGRLLQIQDKDNNQITLSYNARGLISTIRSSNGDALYIDYDTASGRESNIIGLRSETLRNGVVSSTQKIRYEYDSLNRLSLVSVDLTPEDGSIADGNTYTTRYSYDGTSKRISSIEQTDGSRLNFTYTQVNGQYRIATVQDIRSASDNRLTRFDYASDGLSTTITDPSGQKVRLEYNAKGELLHLYGPVTSTGQQHLAYSYDANGNVTSMTDARGNTTVYQYDANGNCIYERDALGNVTERSYNSNNQMTSQTRYRIADPDGSGPQQPQEPQTTHYLYDDKGHLRFTLTPEGRVTEYRYDANGRVTSQMQYSKATYSSTQIDLAKLQTWVATQNITQRVDTSYDLRGLASEVTSYSKIDASGNGIKDGSQSTTHYIYDANGNVLQSINSLGGQTHYQYDGLNRIVSQKDALGNVTTTVYSDSLGQTKITLANGLTTISQYDKGGNLISNLVQDSGGVLGITTYQYDQMDRLRCVTDALGSKSWSLYNEVGLQTGVINSEGTLTEYRYNQAGQVIRTIVYGNSINPALLQGDPTTLTLAQLKPANSDVDRHRFIVYNQLGQMVRTIEADGGVTTYQYDGIGQLISTAQLYTKITSARMASLVNGTGELQDTDANIQVGTNGSDRIVRQFYDADGLLVGTLDEQGYLTEQRYDASGRLLETIRYANVTATALQTAGTLSQLRPAINVADQHTRYFYDGQSRLVGTLNAENYLTELQYDSLGNKTTEIYYAKRAGNASELNSLRPASDTEDRVSHFQYDELNRLIRSESQPQGVVVTYSYDTMGNLIRTDTKGGVGDARSQLSRYDAQGRLIAQLSAEGAKALLSATTQAQIDAVWDKWGTSYTYNTLGQLVQTEFMGKRSLYYYDSLGRLTHTINAEKEVSQTNYNQFGEVESTRQYAKRLDKAVYASLIGGSNQDLQGILSTSNQDIVQQMQYDTRGRLTKQIDGLGRETQYVHNSPFHGVSQTLSKSLGGEWLTTSYLYNRRGLLSETRQSYGGVQLKAVKIGYDAFGRSISSTDAMGNITRYQYDKLGRQISTTNAQNSKVQISYDAFGRTLSQTDALGHTTTWQYDGRTMTITSAEGIKTSTTTNAFGETVEIVDGNGNKTTYEYDLNGQLIKTTAPSGTTTSEYDAAGQLIKAIDARGIETHLYYDAVGRVLSSTVDPTGLNLTTRYEYDALGRTSRVIAADGRITETQYDAAGQVIRTIEDVGRLNVVTDYRYDEAGQTVEVTKAVGTAAAQTVRYQYDALGRRTSETIDPEGLAVTTHYIYNQNDQVVAKTDALGNVTRFIYDELGQQTHSINAQGGVTETRYNANGQVIYTVLYAKPINTSGLPQEITLSDIASQIQNNPLDQKGWVNYNQDGQVTQQIDALGYVTSFQYDKNGNAISKIRHAQPGTVTGTVNVVSNAADQQEYYYYDSANRLSHSIDAAGYLTEYQYDANGNAIHTIQYANKVATPIIGQKPQVTANTNDRHTYNTYDSLGRQTVSVDALGYATQYQYDANGQVTHTIRYAKALTQAQISNLSSFDGQSLLMATTSQNINVYYHYDTLGRQIEVIDTLGNKTVQEYDVIGQMVKSTRAYGTSEAISSTYQYNAIGQLVAKTHAFGTSIANTTRYQYDAAGNLIQKIDARGVEAATTDTTWALETRKALGYVDDKGQAKIAQNLTEAEQQQLFKYYSSHYQYDALGQKITETDALGGITRTEYDAFGNAVKVTDPRGNSGYFYFNELNQAILSITPDGAAVQTDFNAFGKAVTITRFKNQITGAIQTGTKPAIVASTSDQITRIEYDKRNLQTKITDAEGHSERLEYDAFGNKASYTNKLGGTYTYEYNKNGQVTQETSPVKAKNAAGQLVNVVKQYQYDARGNLVVQIEAAGLPEEKRTVYNYDTLDRVVNISIRTQTATGAAAKDLIQESRTYDALSQVIEQTNALGGTTRNWYDALGHKTAERNSEGVLSQWDYDAAGNVITQRIYADKVEKNSQTPVNSENVRLTQYRFDANNRLVASIIPDQLIGQRNPATGNFEISKVDLVTRYTYDATGNLIQQTDGKGGNVYRYYDQMGKKTLEVDAEGYVTSWSYDAAGNITQEHRYAGKPNLIVHGKTNINEIKSSLTISSDDRISQFAYDKLNQVTEERLLNVKHTSVNSTTGRITESQSDAVTHYTYNGLGKVTEQINAEGGKRNTYYDLIGRETRQEGIAFTDYRGQTVRPTTDLEYNGLDQVTRGIARGENSEADDQITRYEYGIGGLLLNQYDAKGNRVGYQYDNAGQISRMTIYELANNQIHTDYGYDTLGREISRKDVSTGVNYETRYNAYGEVTGKRTGTGVESWQEWAEYDNAGRVIKSNSGGKQAVYIYDANGNATLKIEAPHIDITGLSLDEIIQRNDVYRTITQFDKANRVTDIYQPTMTQARDLIVVRQWRTVSPIDNSGTVIEVGPGENGASPANPLTGGAAVIGGGPVKVTATPNFRGTGNAKVYASITFKISIPASVDCYGNGYVRVALNLSNYTEAVAGHPNDKRSSVFDYTVYIPAGVREYSVTVTPEMAWGKTPPLNAGFGALNKHVGFSFVVAKNTSIGEVGMGQGANRAENANIKSQNLTLASDGNIHLNQLRITGQPLNTEKVIMYYRPTGSNAAWQTWDLPNITHLGGFGGYWNHIPVGNYEYQYFSLDGKGNVLNAQQGAMNLSGTPSMTQKPLPSNSAGYAVMGAGNNLYFALLQQNAKSVRIRFQNADGSWTNNFDLGGGGSHNVSLGDARYNLSDRLPHRYIIEALDESGNVMQTTVGSVALDNPNSVTALTRYEDSPSLIHIRNQGSSASYGTVRYRKVGETVWRESQLIKNGIGEFYWDTLDSVNNVDYEFEFLIYNQKDHLMNHVTGEVRLGAETKLLSSKIVDVPTILSFEASSAATDLTFYYRPSGNSGSYQSVTIPRGSNGLFDLDITHLFPKTGISQYEYYYEQFDAFGNPAKNASGEEIGRIEGTLNLNSKAQSGKEDELKYVIVGMNDSSASVHRTQKYNAFGEVIEEIDGRGNKTQFEYNSQGKLVIKRDAETDITLENGAINRVRPTTEYYYDLLGNVVGVKDANERINSQTFLPGSEGGLTLAEYHADGGQKQSQYDVFGNIRIATDEIGRKTNYSYDQNNLLTRINRANGGYNAYEYDARGNRIAHSTTPNGSVVYRDTTSYDSLGRVTETVSAAGRKISYNYQWLSDLVGVAGLTGGWRTVRTDANGRKLVDDKDTFDQIIEHTDLGGHRFSYEYNYGGQLTHQTGTTGQDIGYSYYGNGYIKDISDHALNSYTYYEYDRNGNKTFEGYTTLVDGDNRIYYQYSEVTYDEHNRIKSIHDPKYKIEYEYDAVGNRRRVYSYYHDGLNGKESTQEYWYAYDSMNRFVTTMGTFTGERGSGSIGIGTKGEGVQITYNAAGERMIAKHARDGHTEKYGYDLGGYLTYTQIDGKNRALRGNDLMGRTTSYIEYESAGWGRVGTESHYNADSQLTYQVNYSSTEGKREDESSKTNSYYLADGTMSHTVSINTSTDEKGKVSPETRVETHYGYEWWDDAKQSTITSQPYNENAPNWKPGYSQHKYDVNGHLKEAIDVEGQRSFHYTNNAQGLILRRQEVDHGSILRQHDYYYLDGNRIGDTGNDGDTRVDYAQNLATKKVSRNDENYKDWKPVSSADFDQNYEPIGPNYPGQVLSHYTARNGDSLQSIAMSVWGDSSLWFLLADANGLTGTEKLTAGQVLTIPNKVTNMHNNSGTVRVYNPGEAIGDTSPTLPKAPPPPGKGGCGGAGMIFVAIVAIVVTVITAIFAQYLAPAMSKIAVAAIAAAAGSAASQGTAMAMDMQSSFSWSQVGVAALQAVVTAGISKLATTDTLVGRALVKEGPKGVALRATTGSVVTQGVAVATGMQSKFSWTSVAAAGMGAAVGRGVTDQHDFTENTAKIAQGTIAGMASGAIQASLKGFKNVNWGVIAAESFGNALGDNIAEGIAAREKKDVWGSGGVNRSQLVEDMYVGVGSSSQADYDAFVRNGSALMSMNSEPQTHEVKNGENPYKIAHSLHPDDPQKADALVTDWYRQGLFKYGTKGNLKGRAILATGTVLPIELSSDINIEGASKAARKAYSAEHSWKGYHDEVTRVNAYNAKITKSTSTQSSDGLRLMDGVTVSLNKKTDEIEVKMTTSGKKNLGDSVLFATTKMFTSVPIKKFTTTRKSLPQEPSKFSNENYYNADVRNFMGEAMNDISIEIKNSFAESYLGRFIYGGASGLVGIADFTTRQQVLNVSDMSTATFTLFHNEVWDPENPIYPQLYSNTAKSYSNGTSQGKIILSNTPLVNIGVGTYDGTRAIMSGNLTGGDYAEIGGGLFAGAVVGKVGSVAIKGKPIPPRNNAGIGGTGVLDTSVGAMRRMEYEAAPYHGVVDNAVKSRAPINGQNALDASIQVKQTSPRRVGIDYDSKEFVVFDNTLNKTYHGHVRSWSDLHRDMQNALRESGMVDRKGNIVQGSR